MKNLVAVYYANKFQKKADKITRKMEKHTTELEKLKIVHSIYPEDKELEIRIKQAEYLFDVGRQQLEQTHKALGELKILMI